MSVPAVKAARPTPRCRGLLGWAVPILIAGERAEEHSTEVFVGVDVAKARNAIAVAVGQRGGEARYLGEVDASPTAMGRVVQRLAAKHERVHFCYEAGPTGYGLHRLITSMGHPCTVVAPSLIPKRAGDRVKTNRRDAVGLAKLLRAGELTSVWVPDEGHQAMRDLVRARRGGRDAAGPPPAGGRVHVEAWARVPAQEGLVDALPALAAGTALRAPRAADRASGAGRGGAGSQSGDPQYG